MSQAECPLMNGDKIAHYLGPIMGPPTKMITTFNGFLFSSRSFFQGNWATRYQICRTNCQKKHRGCPKWKFEGKGEMKRSTPHYRPPRHLRTGQHMFLFSPNLKSICSKFSKLTKGLTNLASI